MGVKDLTAVLLKHAPHATKPYKSLSAFRGKTLALDANLLTIKFHHRKKPKPKPPRGSTSSGQPQPAEEDPNRHVKAWYALLRDFRRLDIHPIVVFDGSTRVPEKARENERRRESRELQRRRGEAEGLRAERLREVKRIWGEVEVGDRADVAREFVRLVTSDASQREEEVRVAAETAAEASFPDSSADLHYNNMVVKGAPDWAYEMQETPASRLHSLYEDFQLDAPNPIYSKNQVVLTSSESVFFSHMLHLGMLASSKASSVASGEVDQLSRTLDVSTAEDVLQPGAVASPDAPTTEQQQPDSTPLVPPILDPSHADSSHMDMGLSDLLAASEALGASHLSRAAKVPSRAFSDSVALIQALGVPCLLPPADSPVEAESLCSTLYALGIADYVVSEDSDVTVYGAPLLRQIGVAHGGSAKLNKDGSERRKQGMNVLDPKAVRTALGLTHAQFVDFCLLCGTDFTDRIPNIGPMTALNLARRFGSIEAILAQHPAALPSLQEKGVTPAEYMQTVHAARALFLRPSPLPEGLEDGWWKAREPSGELEEMLVRFGIKRGKVPTREEPQAQMQEAESFAEEADEEDAMSEALVSEAELVPPPTRVTDEEMDRMAEKMAGW